MSELSVYMALVVKSIYGKKKYRNLELIAIESLFAPNSSLSVSSRYTKIEKNRRWRKLIIY